MSKLTDRYLGKIVRLGCVRCRYEAELCGWAYVPPSPDLQQTVVHHLRAFVGGAQRAEDWMGIPLCVSCHTGKHGVHGDRLLLRQLKIDEPYLLCLTIRYFHETYGV